MNKTERETLDAGWLDLERMFLDHLEWLESAGDRYEEMFAAVLRGAETDNRDESEVQ